MFTSLDCHKHVMYGNSYNQISLVTIQWIAASVTEISVYLLVNQV